MQSDAISHPRVEDPIGEPHFCAFLWSSITIHSDGNVTCGLDDPHGVRTFGNVKHESISTIWSNAAYTELRNRLLAGKLCPGCNLYTPVREHGVTPHPDGDGFTAPTPLGPPRFPYPDRLVLEPTIACNIRCNQSVCNINYAPGFQPRAEKSMSYETFTTVIDELGPHLTYMYFFNYGDPFMNSRAEDMLAYAKVVNPAMQIITSTNGIPLAKESRARKVVESGLDLITFTIGGARQESYERYHIRGSLEHALRGMENVCRIKRELGVAAPEVTWRYLTFHWNDSDEEIDEAIALADQIGVDKLRFHLTREPVGAASVSRAPGQPGHARIASMVDFAFGYDRHTPDEHGLYHWDSDLELGTYRWTSARARLQLETTDPNVIVAIATNGPDLERRLPTVTFRGPFGVLEAQPGINAWQFVRLPVPKQLRNGSPWSVDIDVDPTWVPRDYGFNDDDRELGVMLRVEPAAPGL